MTPSLIKQLCPQRQGFVCLSCYRSEISGFVTDFLLDPRLAQLRFHMRGTLQKHGGHLRIGSLFSGWGVLEMTVRELERQWNQVFPDQPLHADVKFLRERDRRKQAYLMTRFSGIPVFQDVADLAKKKAPTADGSAADVPEARK